MMNTCKHFLSIHLPSYLCRYFSVKVYEVQAFKWKDISWASCLGKALKSWICLICSHDCIQVKHFWQDCYLHVILCFLFFFLMIFIVSIKAGLQYSVNFLLYSKLTQSHIYIIYTFFFLILSCCIISEQI